MRTTSATESTAQDTKATTVSPAVVATKSKVTLADHLNLRELPLATTPGGKNFAMKALHPADHEIKTSRIPGGNTMSVALNCDMVETIPITTANASVGISVIPNIVCPASVEVIDGASTDYYNFLNAAFGGSVIKNMTEAHIHGGAGVDGFVDPIFRNIETYRITSQSVTVELIAPSLSDQGTITAAQYHLPPRSSGFVDIAENGMNVHPEIEIYEKRVTPSQLVLGTSAYTSKAREGCYMPLKLTDFHFQNLNDSVIPFSVGYEVGHYTSSVLRNDDSIAFPFYINRSSNATFNYLTPLPRNCGYNFGFIAMTGMAANVAIRLRVRQVVEITCYPSTMYSPLMEVSLPPDEVALKMYMEVSARCKDAYPASYNDLGKLKSIVSSIAKNVFPFVEPALDALTNVPGVPGAIAKGAKVLMPAIAGFYRAAETTPSSAWAQGKGGKPAKTKNVTSKAVPKKGPKQKQSGQKSPQTSAKTSPPAKAPAPTSASKPQVLKISSVQVRKNKAGPGKPGSSAKAGGGSPRSA